MCGSSCGWCVVDGNSWTTAGAAELLARFPVLGGGRGGRGGDDAEGGGGGGGEGGGNGKRRTQSRRIPGGFRPVPAAASATRWRSIPRVPPNISWAEFTEFQQKGIPVIFEGWLAHAAPELASWDLKMLSKRCGTNMVQFSQRRAQFIREIKRLLGQARMTWALDWYIKRKTNATLEDFLRFAETPVDLRGFIEDLVVEADAGGGRQRNSHSTLLDYLIDKFSINDLSLMTVCPEMLRDITLPYWAMASHLECPTQIQLCVFDRRLDPAVFIEPDGARAYPAHQHGTDLSNGFQVRMVSHPVPGVWSADVSIHLHTTRPTR